MSKAVTENFHWQGRAASYSTHGSRRGINNLGWESEEWLSAKQERDCLAARAKQLHDWLTVNPKTKGNAKERAEKIKEASEVNARINQIRPKLAGRFSGLGSHMLDVLRENTPPVIWQRHYEEAIKRWNAAQEEMPK